MMLEQDSAPATHAPQAATAPLAQSPPPPVLRVTTPQAPEPRSALRAHLVPTLGVRGASPVPHVSLAPTNPTTGPLHVTRALNSGLLAKDFLNATSLWKVGAILRCCYMWFRSKCSPNASPFTLCFFLCTSVPGRPRTANYAAQFSTKVNNLDGVHTSTAKRNWDCLSLCTHTDECKGINVHQISAHQVQCYVLTNSTVGTSTGTNWILYWKSN